jgi:hypothetical protein
MIQTYQAGILVKRVFRTFLIELKMDGRINDYQESPGIISTLFTVDATPEMHSKIQAAVKKFNS